MKTAKKAKTGETKKPAFYGKVKQTAGIVITTVSVASGIINIIKFIAEFF